jgi:hypothetical protein
MMPGVTFGAITKAIVDGYDHAELAQTLRERMDLRLDLVTALGRFSNVVFELLSWAERNGREVELIRAVAQAKPANLELQKVYEQYGMAIPTSVQTAGRPVLSAPKYVSESGLDEIVRTYNPAVNLLTWRTRLTDIEGQVCRILIDDNSAGTGFLVGPRAVLTAYHVLRPAIENPKLAPKVCFQFDYKELRDKTRKEGPMPGLDSAGEQRWLLDKSLPTPKESANNLSPGDPDPALDQLDYALVRLNEAVGNLPSVPHPGSGAPKRAWIRVPRVEPVIGRNMALIIPQHPDGQPLQIALDTNAVDEAAGFCLNGNRTRLRYATTAERGASGSPCLNLDLDLIAVHHYGYRGHSSGLGFNQGIPIAAIWGQLRQNEEAAAELGS